jgi:hypothetical protein
VQAVAIIQWPRMMATSPPGLTWVAVSDVIA